MVCNLIPLAAPIATIIAAGAAVYVTWHIGQGQLRIAEEQKRIAQQQAELASARLRHDLYDRRFAVYTATRELISFILQHCNPTSDQVIEFAKRTAEDVFLFGEDIVEYLHELNAHATALSSPSLKDHRGSDDYRWVASQYMAVAKKFQPYLTLQSLVPPN